ncbi:MAG: hypothetical protein COB16_05620 [Rhodobacteraceae bacterium]|nr:MAG: hypothetical protein COB16_05620 [Paracoccaceae bacterium]
MHSVSAVGGLNTAQTSAPHNKQPGPPDHAKAWGWRAKQAASAEETQATATTTEPAVAAETTTAVKAVGDVDQISQDATTTLPLPSEADMESVLLGLASGTTDGTSQDAAAGYDIAALFV